jgi:23S rRNA pseudouridine2605 synthase
LGVGKARRSQIVSQNRRLCYQTAMENDTEKKTGGPRKPPSRGKPARKPGLPKPLAKAHEGERIAKVMARAGLCSRRDAELWIEQGRVAVNGETLRSAARNVTDKDHVTIDGHPLSARERTRLFLFHKPRGLVTTDRDPEGRPTVFDYIAEKNPHLPRLMSVGRLDINTEGLLLLTNDGGLARVLELPSTGWLRRYRARANGETDQAKLDTLAKGVTIDGVDYAGVEARLDRVQGANVWITLGLREGKNREVKRLLEHLGLATNRLIRLSYGPFQLGEMPEGAVEEVRTRVLEEQLGAALAEQAGVDFAAPVIDRSPEPEPRAQRAFGERPGPRPKRPPAEERRAPSEKKAGTEKPGPRKHVSALRSERVKAEKGPRRRTESGATEDRHGRKVVVERVSAAAPKQEAVENRNARRFRAEREKQDDFAQTARKGRAEKRFARPDDRERPAGKRKFEGRPEGGFSGEAGAKKFFRRDGARPEGGPGGKPAGRSGGKFGDKPGGKFGDRPGGAQKPPGKSFGGKFSGKSSNKPSGRPSGKPGKK